MNQYLLSTDYPNQWHGDYRRAIPYIPLSIWENDEAYYVFHASGNLRVYYQQQLIKDTDEFPGGMFDANELHIFIQDSDHGYYKYNVCIPRWKKSENRNLITLDDIGTKVNNIDFETIQKDYIERYFHSKNPFHDDRLVCQALTNIEDLKYYKFQQ